MDFVMEQLKKHNPRITKKQRYINGLVFDINHFKTDLERMIKQKQFTTWYHGKLITRTEVRENLEELRVELDRINNEPDYKPWQDMDI